MCTREYVGEGCPKWNGALTGTGLDVVNVTRKIGPFSYFMLI